VQAQTISALTWQIEFLTARVSELETKLSLPPKTPNNSSTPPSQGRTASVAAATKPERKVHAGAHRPLIASRHYSAEGLLGVCRRLQLDLMRPQAAFASK
jgi:transposase